jgi:hypothetical protein
MDLSTLIVLSCVLTGITMVFFVGGIAFLLRYGGKGVTSLFNRFLGGGKDKNENDLQEERRQAPAKASGQSFRQRAQSLDFPAPPGAQQFSAQAIPQQGQYPDFPAPSQASLTPRMGQDPLGGGGQQFQQQQSFRPSTPSLSASRPFNSGFTQQAPPNYPQQGGVQQRPLSQQGNAQAQGGLRQPPPLQQGGFQQQPPQQGYGQQQPPQQGGLGQNRPPLQSRPRPDDSGLTGRRQFSPGRDNRRQDDYDRIYDDGEAGGFGDILDGF